MGAFLIGCAVLLVVGCAGVRSEAPQEEQEHTEATKEQARSPEATASEEDRCGETRTIDLLGSASASVADSSIQPGDPEARFITNDVPGCRDKGGLLSGTDKPDRLAGRDGDDEMLWGGGGEDVLYGGDGNDYFDAVERPFRDTHRDELYCGEGTDEYVGGRLDYVDSSCEVKR